MVTTGNPTREQIETCIDASDPDCIPEQQCLEVMLGNAAEVEVQLMIIEHINPDVAWETLAALACRSPSPEVATAAVQRLNRMRDDGNRTLAYVIIAQKTVHHGRMAREACDLSGQPA